jgi:hypothetical protein
MRGTQVKRKHEVGVNMPEGTEDCKLQWANVVEHVMTLFVTLVPKLVHGNFFSEVFWVEMSIRVQVVVMRVPFNVRLD